jgi:hypothetical protein
MTDPVMPSATPPASMAVGSAWRGFGMAERVAAAGAAAILIGWILGIASERWSINVEALVFLIGSALVLVVLFAGAAVGRILPRVLTLRTAATLCAAFALMDLALLVTDLDEWSSVTIVLTSVYLVGSALLLWGAWGATGGSLAGDLRSLGGLMSGTMTDRLIVGGAILALLGWFAVLLVAQVFNFVQNIQISVLAVALILVVRWSARDPRSGIRWPVPASYVIAALAVIAAVFALLWFLRIIDDTLDRGGLDVFLPIIVYLGGLALLVVGAVLIVRPQAGAPAT